MPDHNQAALASDAGPPAPIPFPGRLALLLTARRAAAWCAMLMIVEILTLSFMVAGTHGMFTEGPLELTTDFSSFYAAGRLADAGQPALAYDAAAHYAQEKRDTSPGIIYSYFYYPPVFLLLCALLARLPYLAAFIVFQLAAGFVYLAAATRILARKHWVAAIAILAFPSNFWNIGLGQNGLLTAGLFGFATWLVDRRPMLAGLLFGCLIYKPHFGLLVPVALLAGGHWRAVAGATISVLGLCALSLLCFGSATWVAYLQYFSHSPSLYQSGKIAFYGMVSVFAAMRLEGVAQPTAYAVQAVATLFCMGAVFVVWRRHLSLPVRAATLMAATVCAVPLILFYDLTIISVAIAWLCQPAARTMTVTEKLLIAAVVGLTLMVIPLTSVLMVPLGLSAACVVLGMALYRAAGEIRSRPFAVLAEPG